MTSLKVFAIAILIPFSLLSAYAVSQVGYVGIVAYHLPSPAGWQVIADLVIAIVVISLWMIRDARQSGRNVWPYLALSLFLGSFGVLFYLLLAPSEERATTPQPA